MAINRETYALSKAYTDRVIKEHGGSNNYNDLSNQPKINGVTLIGNKSGKDLRLSTTYTVEEDTLIIS